MEEKEMRCSDFAERLEKEREQLLIKIKESDIDIERHAYLLTLLKKGHRKIPRLLSLIEQLIKELYPLWEELKVFFWKFGELTKSFDSDDICRDSAYTEWKEKLEELRDAVRKEQLLREGKREQLTRELESLEYDCKIARRVAYYIDHRQSIFPWVAVDYAQILKRHHIDYQTGMMLLHEISNHNYRIYGWNIAEAFDTWNWLFLGYEKLPWIKEKYQREVTIILTILENFADDLNEAKPYLPMLDSLHYTKARFLEVMMTTLYTISLKIHDLQKIVGDKDYRRDYQWRLMTKEALEYYCRIYSFLRDYCDQELDQAEAQSFLQSEEQPCHDLFYSHKGDHAFILRDLKELPKEYLYKVFILCQRLKFGTLSPRERKSLISNKMGYFELKKDQVRIVFRTLGERNYEICGVGVKKSDQDRLLYQTLMSRPDIVLNPDTYREELDFSKEVEESLKTYCLKEMRQGTR